MKLASVELIQEVLPHPNADRLSLVKVLGYTAIVPKDAFQKDEAVLFIQPDTVLPDSEWAAPFKKYAQKRVKAIRIRGVYSFGLVVKPHSVPELRDHLKGLFIPDRIGQVDVADIIGLTKYETPQPQCLEAKGPLPFGIYKTDEDRWQIIENLPFGEECDFTLKIDGMSATYYCKKTPNGEWVTGICSRSLELKPDCVNPYTRINAKYDILSKLRDYCMTHSVSLALRGEIYGQGIQSSPNNPHSKKPLDFAAFSVLDLDTLLYRRRNDLHGYLNVASAVGVPIVPQIGRFILSQGVIDFFAQNALLNDEMFEGIVVQHDRGSFKVINLSYDEKK